MIENLYITGLKNIPQKLYGYRFTVWVTEQIVKLLPKLDFTMLSDYISVAHPIFKDGEMTNTVIVRFTHRDVRNAIFFNKTKIVDKNVYINEQLTNRNRELLKEAKEIVGPRNAWSSQCKLYAKVGADRIKIISDNDITLLKEKHNTFESLSPEAQEEVLQTERQKRKPLVNGPATASDSRANPQSNAPSTNNFDMAKSKWPNMAESDLLAAIEQYQSKKQFSNTFNNRGRGNKQSTFRYGGGGVGRGDRNYFNRDRRYNNIPQYYNNHY